MTLHILENKSGYCIYDDIYGEYDPDIFFCATNASRINTLGRGSVAFFTWKDLPLVKREYRRGGLVRNLARRSYLYLGLKNTRMWREFVLLRDMVHQKLPVPTPVAASVNLQHGFIYHGELITREILASRSVAELFLEDEIVQELWSEIGATIKRFHVAGVYHADLNANNILVDKARKVWLIDFDRGELRSSVGQGWQQANLSRLLRSLNKCVKNKSPMEVFDEQNWQSLLQGYHSG